MEECPSGLRSTLGKRVYAINVPWVRIPPPPTHDLTLLAYQIAHVVSESPFGNKP